jgi:hypothetical protein
MNYVQFAREVRKGIREAFPQGAPEVKPHFLYACWNVGMTPDTTAALFEALVDGEEGDFE